MTQHPPVTSQQSANGNRGSRSKHFLSRFLATSPQVYAYDTTNTNATSAPNNNNSPMIPSDDTNRLTQAINKPKKNKGIGKRMLKRFTSKSDHHGSTLWNKDTSPTVHHHSLPSARTNLSTPIAGRYPPDYDDKIKTTKNPQLIAATDLDKAQRRRSATLPSVFHPPPKSAGNITTTTTTTDMITEQRVSLTDDGGSVYSAFSGTTDEDDGNDPMNNATNDEKRLSMNNIHNNDDGDDDDDSSSSSDESFVDASDELYSEKGGSIGKKKRSSLTHRLSAGRFGSAGGLVVNMHPSVHHPQRRSRQQQQQLRNSLLPPDDLAQAMLDWKRKSVGDGTINKRFSGISNLNSNTVDDTTVTTIMETATPPPRPLSEMNDDDVDDEYDSPELSKEDKEALRAHTANILMGGNDNHRTDTSPQLQDLASSSPSSRGLHHERSRSIKALSEMFSKSLDEAWNNSDAASSQELVDQVRDPRLSNVWNRPTHLSPKAKETAKRFWDCDESVLPVDHYAEWLGQSTKYNAETLVCYMDLFYFGDMNLDSAFRKLCSKLYFKAEAQQIDRILEVFAHRYWDCNPRSNFKCADVVYAVVYSLLLLNTDLHVAQGNHHRMTKQEFVKNTMLAIHSQLRLHPEIDRSTHFDMDTEKYLKELYISVKNYQILQPIVNDDATTPSDGSDIKSAGHSLRHVETLKRGVNSIIRKAGRESMMLTNYETPPMTRPASPLSPSRVSMQHSPLPSTSSTATSPYRMSTATRRLSRSLSLRQASTLTSTSAKYHSNGSLTSIGSSTLSSGIDGSASKANDDSCSTRQSKRNTGIISSRRLSSASPTLSTVSFTPGTFLHDAPYAKESVVMCKHLLESSEQKAKSREWREQLMVVDDQGVIKLYDIPGQKETERMAQGSIDLLRPHHIRHTKKYIEGPLSTFNPSWNDLLVLTIDLKHTLSNVLPPPGYNKIRPHVFAFQQPNGGVYLFQGTSLDDVTSWVSTCNYWAARQSKEPLQGGVGSMDYGWGDCLNNVIVDLDAIQNGDSLTGNTVGDNDADDLMIYDWQPPVAPSVPSNYTDDPTGQLEALSAHLRWLNAEINAHREIKTKMLVRFPKRSFNYKRALSNWSLKSSYLLGDIIKYQHYCDALENSIQLLASPTSGSGNVGLGQGALDNVGLIDFHDMDLIKEIENELDL
ncbi:hypothetical protein BCR42DRAFT_416293 [Absidia repens]|uniref:SEC7 domain-containing protein n=1 Tax=Absidia repens TaxID=90262 RepID=A0A1X2IE85_9FUNG|nr:hypothetical protein BCR42DRAFT_416293 [Absidia repens]